MLSTDFAMLVCLILLGYKYLLQKSINPFSLYTFVWFALLAVFFLGPIEYSLASNNGVGLLYVFLNYVAFVIGYFSIRPVVSQSPVHSKEEFPNVFIVYSVIGVAFTLIGGYQGVDTSAENLGEIRDNLYSNITLFAQIGAILFCFYLFLIVDYLYSSSDRFLILKKIVILLGLITPVFSAGRQLYLFFLLTVFFSLAYQPYSQIASLRLNLAKRLFFVKLAGFIALIFLFLISILRFTDESVNIFGSKLEMFERYSSITIRPSYKLFYDLFPEVLRGLIVESTYYFSAQVGRFVELFEMNSFSFFNFDALMKFPFLDRNVGKLMDALGYSASSTSINFNQGHIANFTWSTSLSTNIIYFGLFGALFISFVFGLVCKISFAGTKSKFKSIYAHNFLIANSIIAFYSIIASPLMDTFFFFYYFISFFAFFVNVKFTRISFF